MCAPGHTEIEENLHADTLAKLTHACTRHRRHVPGSWARCSKWHLLRQQLAWMCHLAMRCTLHLHLAGNRTRGNEFRRRAVRLVDRAIPAIASSDVKGHSKTSSASRPATVYIVTSCDVVCNAATADTQRLTA